MNELTPNVKRLIIYRVSRAAIPDGGGLVDGFRFFSDPEKRKAGLANAAEWVKQAIATVRTASEPNPWRNADDETIATEIMRKVDKRVAAQPAAGQDAKGA